MQLDPTRTSALLTKSLALSALALCAISPSPAQDAPRRPKPPVGRVALPLRVAPPKRIDLAQLIGRRVDASSLADLRRSDTSAWSPTERLAALANLPARYGTVLRGATTPPVSGTASNGVRYFVSRANPSLPAAGSGVTETERGADDLIVCKSTPMSIARQFAGPLMVAGMPASQNQSVIYPGALFRDSDVVRGLFTPQTPARRTGHLDIDVLNVGGPVSVPVANLNDRSQVNTAINTLRSGAATAAANTYLEYVEATFRASSQLNVEFEASMDADLEAVLGAPIAAGASTSASLGFEESVNVAVAALSQVFYTISLGGEGPASTVEADAGPGLLCVTDVQYGRRAFLMVGSHASRAEAALALSQLVSVGAGGGDIASGESGLSAEARVALESGFVRVAVVGGSALQAVQVRDLATLRNYVTTIDPSVAGVNAVPIAYTLRYAADNAPARVGAFADLVDHECFRAQQVRVTLNWIKPTKVVDFGDEELYGTIKVIESGNLTRGQRTLWSRSKGEAVQGREGVAIQVGESGTFNFNRGITTADEVEIEIELKDRIMGAPDPEFAGASATDRDRGYAVYGRKVGRIALADVRDAASARLSKTFTVREGQAEVDVRVTVELLAP